MRVVLTGRNRCSRTNTPRWDFSKTFELISPTFLNDYIIVTLHRGCVSGHSPHSPALAARGVSFGLVSRSFLLWHSEIGGEIVIRLIKRLLMKLDVREAGETRCQDQRVLDPHIPAWTLVPIPSLKSRFMLLCPDQRPDQLMVPSGKKTCFLAL